MSGNIKRRTLLKASGAVAGASVLMGKMTGEASAGKNWGFDNECNPGYTTRVSDSDNDYSLFLSDCDNCDNEHYYQLDALADIKAQEGNCTEGEELMAELYQEREDCSTGTTSFEKIDSVTASCSASTSDSCSNKESVNGKVPISDGCNWRATGTYRVDTIPCFWYDTDTCHTWSDTRQCPDTVSDPDNGCSEQSFTVTYTEGTSSC